MSRRPHVARVALHVVHGGEAGAGVRGVLLLLGRVVPHVVNRWTVGVRPSH